MTANPSLWLDWNSDFIITPSGSLQVATGWDLFRQRVVRRTITNKAQQLPSGVFTPADYVFDPEFGEGLGSLVDQPESADDIADIDRRIVQGVSLDSDADPSFQPQVLFEQPQPTQLNIFVSAKTVSGLSGVIAYGNVQP